MMKASRDRTPVVSSLSCPLVVLSGPQVVLDDVGEEASEERVGVVIVVLVVFDPSSNCACADRMA